MRSRHTANAAARQQAVAPTTAPASAPAAAPVSWAIELLAPSMPMPVTLGRALEADCVAEGSCVLLGVAEMEGVSVCVRDALLLEL